MTLWHAKISDAISVHGPGALVVAFPAYRPDLAEALAAVTGCAYLDFRARYMAPLRFEAHKLPLDALEEAMTQNANAIGLVLQNAEALLAAKPAPERAAWLADFLARARRRLALLPMALFGREAGTHPRVVHLLPHEVPEENLLTQLGSTRLFL